MVAYFIFIVKVSYLMCQTLLYTPLCMDFRERHFKKKKKREREKQDQRKWASSPLGGEPPGFSRVGAGALDLRRGPQGPALVFYYSFISYFWPRHTACRFLIA